MAGGIAFTTLGLSNYKFRSRVSDKLVRQELLMLVPPDLGDGPVPGLLQQVGTELIGKRQALLRGDVVGPRGSLFNGSSMEALYASAPAYLPPEFAVCECGSSNVVITWLVPISHEEAHYVFNQGWSAFEETLAEVDPDLVNVKRGSIV